MQAAAEHAQRELARIPNAAKLETPPSWAEQQKHVLTHPPLCSLVQQLRMLSCKKRPPGKEWTDASRRSSAPCISFDFGYVKSVPQDADPKEIDAMIALSL